MVKTWWSMVITPFKINFLRVDPAVTNCFVIMFWHSIQALYSDMLFWHAIWHLFWHSILPFYLAFILAFFLAFHLACYSGIYPGILSGMPTEIWSSRLRSGWDLELAVEARQCPLRSGARGWGLAVPTAIRNAQLRSEAAGGEEKKKKKEEEERRRRIRRKKKVEEGRSKKEEGRQNNSK